MRNLCRTGGIQMCDVVCDSGWGMTLEIVRNCWAIIVGGVQVTWPLLLVPGPVYTMRCYVMQDDNAVPLHCSSISFLILITYHCINRNIITNIRIIIIIMNTLYLNNFTQFSSNKLQLSCLEILFYFQIKQIFIMFGQTEEFLAISASSTIQIRRKHWQLSNVNNWVIEPLYNIYSILQLIHCLYFVINIIYFR